MIPLRRSLKKSKKHRAIAPAALGGCGGLGQLWEALAELREALGELWEGLEELWEALYIDKLPINRTAAAMLPELSSADLNN